MRTLLLIMSLMLASSVFSQTIREIILPFNDDQCLAFEPDVQQVIDSVYFNMRQGEKIKLRLYNRFERKMKTHVELQSLTSNRARLVNSYLEAKKNYSSSEIEKIIPFNYNLPPTGRSLTDYMSPDLEKPIPGLPAVILQKTEPYQKFYTHLNDSLINRNEMEYSISASMDQHLFFQSGLEISFLANSFVQENGAAHSCSEIKILVEEYLKTAEMLSADLTTHSNGKMLESGGMIYIEAWCGTQKLKLKPGKSIEILFPSITKKEGMKTFNGRKSKNMSDWVLQNGGEVKIVPDELIPETEKKNNNERFIVTEEISYEGEGVILDGEYEYDSLAQQVYDMTDGYLLTSLNLGWINCDRFYEVENKTELLVSSNSKEPICYRIVFKDIKSIIPAYDCGANGTFKFDDIPAGEKVILVAFYVSRDKKTALFAAKEITLGETKNEKLLMENTTPEALKAQFSDLFPN